MYKSLIDGHECTQQHYLVEFVISRKAKKLGLSLPHKFWNTDEWKKEYKLQMIAANSLLKIFTATEILEGLRSKEGNWIYSLQNRTLIDIINRQKVIEDKNQKTREEMKNIDLNIDYSNETVVKPIQQKKKNTLDTLEEIDAELQRNNF